MISFIRNFLLVVVLWSCTSENRTREEEVPGYPQGLVPFERLVKSESEPHHWLSYSGNYFGHRFSPLNEINTRNVGNLKMIWQYQVQQSGLIETTPLVVDGVMYITEPPSTVSALDIGTGRRLWSWTPQLPAVVKTIGFPRVNRGVAILDDMVYVATLDAHLVALDSKSGVVRWDVTVADNNLGFAFTLAPMAINNKIVVGVSGGEAGIRGFLDAYNAKTGEKKWRFWTIPGEGESGVETWGGDSWKTGAGATWLTGSYDPELNLIYWGIGNPGPDWNGDVRPGDNLFTCSVVALDGDTGEMKWYYQFTPHDVHDWDANQIPVLVDETFKGEERKLLIMANRNAFYYILDRVTGEFLQATPYAKQTWAERIDDGGRPVVLPDTEPTPEGTLVYPSLQGATNWFSPSYSPLERALFVSVREMGSYYFKSDVDFEPGEPFLGGGEQALSGDQAKGYVKAIDAMSGDIKWEFDLHSPPWSGVMSTAGGLVFGGSNEGNIYALSTETGNVLWDFQTGGAVRNNPMSFGYKGRQYIVMAAGGVIMTFGLP